MELKKEDFAELVETTYRKGLISGVKLSIEMLQEFADKVEKDLQNKIQSRSEEE